MPHPGQPISAADHAAYQHLAWTLVNRIIAVLRPEEVNDCALQFYEDIRAHCERQKEEKRVAAPRSH